MAYGLIKKLTEQHQHLILQELSNTLNNAERKEGKLHNVFETSFDWKPAGRQTGNAVLKNSFSKN